ncbi:MAG TPA: TlpA disulfide reductase family protein [Terriglobia bacterium]|nr:TlpA disulfide reductase family protein [Terriglobia bacterium]
MRLNKRTWVIAAVVAVVLGGILAVRARRRTAPLSTGDRVPAFTLQNASAGTLSFKDSGHHVTLINFWATWCPPCVMEAPSLEKFARRMQPLGVRVIGVSVDQDLPSLQKFISGYGITYPILRDPYQALAGRFGTHMFPETYIFDRDGRLADKIIGATDWTDPEMIQFVQDLSHWPPATTAKTASAPGNW